MDQVSLDELHEGCEKRGGVCDCNGRPCYIDMRKETEEIREEERLKTEALKRAGKCAKTPALLVGPGCTFDPDHEGRCSWGAWFEPDGSFHLHDPEALPSDKSVFNQEFPFLDEGSSE